MVAAAVGFSVRGYVPFASTFAAFLTRAYDFIRMAAISQANICLVGSHAGVEIGADGPSQMALEDLAMMRAVHGSTVLYPSDATSTCALVAAMADRPGVKYMRTTRGAYPVLYRARRAVSRRRLQGADERRKTRSPSSAPASPCTTASPPPRRSAMRASRRESSTSTPSSRPTPPPSPPRLARLVGSSWSRTITPRADSARPSSRRWLVAGSAAWPWRTWPSPTCPAQGRRRNCWPRPACPPPTSPPRHER